MPRNRLTLQLDRWRAALAAEPAALGRAADPIVQSRAEAAADALRLAYPRGETGNLVGGVRVDTRPGSEARVVQHVVSGAPHAHLYEYGTHVARPHATFHPITGTQGRALDGELQRMVSGRGYTVRGSGDE